jgi:hypothetical protein
MENIFNVRTQKIESVPPSFVGNISFVLEEAGETKEALDLRGKLYAVVEVSADRNTDLSLIFAIIKNTISDRYFGNLDGTPLVALEEAVLAVKERLAAFTNPDGSASNLVLGFGAVVIWGNVVYLAQVGDNQTLLLRNSEVVTLGEETGGDIRLRSSILEEDDVFICATGEFLRKFSVDFILKNSLKIEEQLDSFKDRSKLCACVVSVSSKTTLSPRDFIKVSYPKIGKHRNVGKKVAFVGVSLIALFLIAGVFYFRKTLISVNKSSQNITVLEVVEKKEVVKEEVFSKPFINMVDFGDGTPAVLVFEGKDLKMINGEFSKQVLINAETGAKIKSEDIVGISSLLPVGRSAMAEYLENWYLATNDPVNIEKISPDLEGYIKKEWLKDKLANPIKDIVVDYYIYVLFTDGSVSRLLSGNKTEFSLLLNGESLTTPEKIYTDSSIDNIYVWDNGKNSLFIFNKEGGGFVEKFVIPSPLKDPEVLDMLVLEGDKTTLFLSTKSYIYKFEF